MNEVVLPFLDNPRSSEEDSLPSCIMMSAHVDVQVSIDLLIKWKIKKLLEYLLSIKKGYTYFAN